MSQINIITPRILRLPEVIQKTGLSRSSIYAMIKEELFPKCYPLGKRSVGWLESEVVEWINKRIDLRTHVLVVHHSGKDTQRGARGHSALRAATDTEIEVTKAENIITAEVKKQRDGKTGVQYNFSLNIVELGLDEDGDPLTSCALTATAESPTKKPHMGKKGGQIDLAYRYLIEFINEVGELVSPNDKMPEVRAVRLSEFKEYLKSKNICTTDKPDNHRRMISRVITELQKRRFSDVWEDYIWVAGQTGQDRTDT